MVNLYIINQKSKAAVYGIGTYIAELTAAIRKNDINIYVVHLNTEKPDGTLEESDDIRHLFIPPPTSQNSTIDWNVKNYQYYRNVVYLLRLQIKNVENLVFQINYTQTSQLVEELKKSFDCKMVSVVHYSDWGIAIYDNLQRLRTLLQDENPDDFSKNLKNSVEEEMLSYSTVDRVVCLSNYMREVLIRDYKLDSKKISVIPNGLTDKAQTMTDRKILRKKWKITFKNKIIFFAGRMEEIKGISYLIEAFRKVLSVYSNSRLVIAGEGEFSKYTKSAQDICTKITFTGMLNKTQLYEWYRLADVGVTPSLFEPFGYVTVEMMMHELPVVATKTSGLNEVVDDNCGLKIPIITHTDKVEIDADLLAEKIMYLLQYPSEAKKMGKNGRKRYLTEYTTEVFRRNMLELYRSLFVSDI